MKTCLSRLLKVGMLVLLMAAFSVEVGWAAPEFPPEFPPVAQPALPQPMMPSTYPPDPTADISWSAGTSGVADIQAAFNNARALENSQLGTNIPLLTMPLQMEWDALSDSAKVLWLGNRERLDRGVAPLHGVEINVTSVAQTYAQYLLDNNAWGHTADGRSPWQRLDANPAIGSCRDFLNVAENLAVFVTSGSSIPLPIERSVYMWMYDDSGSSWGHRHAILWYPYNDNSGSGGKEGFLGIGRASGGPYQGPFSQPWNFAELIVMNVFDPCSAWVYAPEAPAAPTNLSVALVSQTAITLTWSDASANEDGFKIERSPDGSSGWAQVGAVGADVTGYADAGLMCGTPYFYRVRAHNAAGDSAYSNVANGNTATCPLSPPAAPTNLSVALVSQTAITLTWSDASANEDGFKIERSPDGSSGWAQVGAVGADVTGYADTGLACGTPYFYRVRAHNAAGDSAYSNVANGNTAACPLPPAAPTNLSVALVSQTAITLTWSDVSANEDGFKIERSPDGSSGWAQVGAVGADAMSYADAGLTCGTPYFYRVRAHNAAGDSAYSNVANGNTAACPLPPAAPTNLSVALVSQTAITLTWSDASANEDGFKIERSPDGSSGWVQVGAVGADVTSYADVGLQPATSYSYRVVAYNAVGNSAYSNIAVGTTVAPPPITFTKACDTGGLSPVPLGGVVTYTLTLVNTTAGILHDVALTDVLPSGVSFRAWSGYTGSSILPPPGTVELPHLGVVWRPGDLAARDVMTLAFSVDITTNVDFAGDTIVNIAQASVAGASAIAEASFHIEAAQTYLYLPLVMRTNQAFAKILNSDFIIPNWHRY